MSHTHASHQRAPRSLVPLIVVVGPLLSALTLTALGYVMFRAQATAGATGQSASSMPSGPLEYTVILALAGALVSLLMGGLGLALYGRTRKWIEAREQALDASLERLETLERLARRIAERGERREVVASVWARRQREALAQMSAMMGPRAALQRLAGDIWAGLSQPGAPLDAPTALRLARESAVAGAALGAALDDMRSLMAAPAAALDEIEAIDEALVQDLMAVDELARQTRLGLIGADNGDSATPSDTPSGRETRLTPALASDNASRAMGRRPSSAPGEKAFEESSAHLRAARPTPYPVFDGERLLPKNPTAWPPPIYERPKGQGNGAPNARTAGSTGQWPRQPADADQPRGGGSSARMRDPRDRDESDSRWLND